MRVWWFRIRTDRRHVSSLCARTQRQRKSRLELLEDRCLLSTTLYSGIHVDIVVSAPVAVGSGAEGLLLVELTASGKGGALPGGFDGEVRGQLHQQTAPGALTSTLDEPFADGSVLVTEIDSHFLLFGADLITVTAPGETVGLPGSSSEPPDATGPMAGSAETGFGTMLSGEFAVIGGGTAGWTFAQLVVPAGSTVELDFKLGFGGASPAPVETVTASFPVHPSGNLDVDDNGTADALTDGVIILRYLFGFTGDSLVQGAVAPDATRTDPVDIAGLLDDAHDTMLDADSSGQADALTDGIVILRYLFGFTGDSLVEDALSPDAQRTDPGEIAAFLDQFNVGAQGAATTSFAPLGVWVETASTTTTATPNDAERIDAVWGDSSQNRQTDRRPARDRSRQMSLFSALAHDSIQSHAKTRKDEKWAADEVDQLILQGYS